MTAPRPRCVLSILICALTAFAQDSIAGPILPTALGTLASTQDAWPAPTGTHIHDTTRVEVGDFRGFEEERGVVEFDLTGYESMDSATLSFGIAFTFGVDFPIDVFAYEGSNGIEVSDYSAPSVGYIGTILSTQLFAGSELHFDISSLLDGAIPSGRLGIRLQAAGFPGVDDRDPVFDNFRLESNPVPEPGSIFLFGTAAAGVLARWRRRAGDHKR